MKDEYDFSKAKKNPYASKLKKQVTIRIDESAINYFKNLAEETGISYQNLVNLYLVDCAKNKRKLEISFS
jgi:predicted DNA binding CopG/RHH family protein